MNEAPSNQTGLNDTFSSQQASQTNPFTADLKGEFTSNFGTNTNAVSQIFKEGGFVNQSRAKLYALGGLALVLVAGLFYFLTTGSEESESDDASTAGETDGENSEEAGDDADKPEDATADAGKDEKKEEEAKAEETPKEEAPSAPVAESTPAGSGGGAVASSGPISLATPNDGASVSYDESQGPAQFSWQGGSGYIVFSRNSSMNPPSMRVFAKGNSYSFHQPWPGKWYWRVENRSGKSEIRSFTVNPPQRRAISLDQPSSGGSLSGNGGVVSWKGDAKVGFYRVEFSTGGWANPQFRFSSSGNSLQVNGVSPGQYQMRLGAFSEVAGRWEYTSPISVTVQ